MRLSHDIAIPAPLDHTFESLCDLEAITVCMPGAKLLSTDGEEAEGEVAVKLGPTNLTFRGRARYATIDREGGRIVVEAQGRETHGAGMAKATVQANLEAAGPDKTAIEVTTDLQISGKAAQFGQGMIAEIGDKLLAQFVECLARSIAGMSADAQGSDGATGKPRIAPPAEDNVVDLASVAAWPVLKRLIWVILAVGIVVWLVWQLT